MFFDNVRKAQTTLSCPQCEHKLLIRKTCHEAYMYCEACQKSFPLKDYISTMDSVMEEFLEGLIMNRI